MTGKLTSVSLLPHDGSKLGPICLRLGLSGAGKDAVIRGVTAAMPQVRFGGPADHPARPQGLRGL